MRKISLDRIDALLPQLQPNRVLYMPVDTEDWRKI